MKIADFNLKCQSLNWCASKLVTRPRRNFLHVAMLYYDAEFYLFICKGQGRWVRLRHHRPWLNKASQCQNSVFISYKLCAFMNMLARTYQHKKPKVNTYAIDFLQIWFYGEKLIFLTIRYDNWLILILWYRLEFNFAAEFCILFYFVILNQK